MLMMRIFVVEVNGRTVTGMAEALEIVGMSLAFAMPLYVLSVLFLIS